MSKAASIVRMPSVSDIEAGRSTVSSALAVELDELDDVTVRAIGNSARLLLAVKLRIPVDGLSPGVLADARASTAKPLPIRISVRPDRSVSFGGMGSDEADEHSLTASVAAWLLESGL